MEVIFSAIPKAHSRREDVEQTIYDLANGCGRGRGSLKGLAAQQAWKTVLLTSGEQSATSLTESGGTRARVLTLWGSPFGNKNEDIAIVTSELNSWLKENYGHAAINL